MNEFYLVIVDTTGIQSYIFGSNRLRENVGASYLVHAATEGWLLKEPNSFLPQDRHNIRGEKRDDALRIERGDVDAELLYAGGGNTVVLFRDETNVKTFGKNLSGRLLEKAPGLDAVMISHPFAWTDNLACVFQEAMQEMARQKQERGQSQPLLGLGITAACASTGLAANYHKPEPGEMPDADRARLSISAEVAAKWDSNGPAKTRLEEQLPLADSSYKYPDDFDHLGRTEGELSYIGVVHADGNGMGKILEEITKDFCEKDPPENRAYIAELRLFSDKASRIGLNALRAVVQQVAAWNWQGEEQRKAGEPPRSGKMALLPGKRKNKDGQEETCISIRPIVFGGDDVTFVCDGRIALQAAKVFLDAFGKEKIGGFGEEKIGGQPAIACAGVAIVKSHYPFARAYELAEELTKNAKNHYRRAVAALDWHLAQSGLFGDLGDIRAEEYEFEPGHEKTTDKVTTTVSDQKQDDQKPNQGGQRSKYTLLMRPLVTGEPSTLPDEVANKTSRWRTWDNFVAILRDFQLSPQNSENGKWPRNKVMDLRTELAASRWDEERHSLRQYIEQLRISLPELKSPKPDTTAYQNIGWIEEPAPHRCVYFDAVESIDQLTAYDSQSS